MCLALITTEHPRYRLVLGFNRDEFYWRPTAQLSTWANGVVAGRDLSSGGTWLATANGRWAFVKNNRGGAAPLNAGARKEVSRGDLPVEFVTGEMSAGEDAQLVAVSADRYRPFHLVVGDENDQLYWVNARPGNAAVHRLPGGAVGFASDGGPAAHWSKVTAAVRDFDDLIRRETDIEDEQLFTLLASRRPRVQQFPTIRENVKRAALSPRKVRLGVYGTRSTTVLLIERDTGRIHMFERQFPWCRAAHTTRIRGIPR